MKQKSPSYVRRFLIAALAVLLVSALCVVGLATEEAAELKTEVQECYIPADFNADGTVTDRDAIYLLYSTFYAEDYPLHSSGDLNNDTKVTEADALFILNAMYFDEENWKAISETRHVDEIPNWTWTGDCINGYTAATVRLSCECGANVTTYTDDELEINVKKAPTCMAPGEQTFVASVGIDGENPITAESQSITLSALGHEMTAADCAEPRKCRNCDHTEGEALGHQWVLDTDKSVAATCGLDGKEVYRCANDNCNATKEIVDLERPAHTYVQQTPVEISTGEACHYQTKTTFTCSGCEASYSDSNEEYVRHDYSIVELTTIATCQTAGVKTFTCSGCGHKYSEETEKDPSAHNWVVDNEAVSRNTVAEDITYYHCAHEGCEETKTTKVVTSDTAVNTNELSGTELQLAIGNGGSEGEGEDETPSSNAALTFDQEILEKLDTEITLSVDTVSEDQLPEMDEAQKELLGDSVVYDFTMKNSNDELITDKFDDGYITITLPYTLEEGEDPDNIVVWYIDNDGTVTSIDATYSNGFVTFRTNHFSYYTVTRLTPAERCEKYGHLELVVKKKDVTCTEDGYHIETCPRCAANVVENIFVHTGHDYVTENNAATCTESGSIVKTCQTAGCGHEISATIPAKGHNMQLDSSSKAASCTENGKNVFICANGCKLQIEEELPATNHDFKLITEHKADCTSNGHKDYECANGCGAKFSEVTEGFTGHLYNDENAVWEWEYDANGKPVSAVCTLHCAYHPNEEVHTHTLKKVTITSETKGVTCTEKGTTTYTATAKYNAKVIFTSTVEQEAPARGHIAEADWTQTTLSHFRNCSVCGVELEREAHAMVDGKVEIEATCISTGKIATSCSECGYEGTRILAATGIHDYDQYRVCRDCGKSESDCRHFRVYSSEIDLSGYDICADVQIRQDACECGYDSCIYPVFPMCEFEEIASRTEISEEGYEYTVNARQCKNCGLIEEISNFTITDEETCTTYYAQYRAVIIGDEVLGGKVAVSESTGLYYDGEHHAIAEYETIELTPEEHGLCQTTILLGTCSCGERKSYEIQNRGCDLQEVSADDGGITYRCTKCDALWRYMESQVTEDGCYIWTTNALEIFVENESVLVAEDQWLEDCHDDQLVDSELFGASCLDFAVAVVECRNCGRTVDRLVDSHVTPMFITEVTDISDYGFCCDEIVQRSCVCGQRQEGGSRGGNCDWEVIEEGIQTIVIQCAKCGLIRENHFSTDATDDPCYRAHITDYIYRDAEGNTIATVRDLYYSGYHDYKQTFELQGDSCEDGVIVNSVCVVCGDSYTSNYDYHQYYTVMKTYDLTGLDMCHQEAEVVACICGQEFGVNWYHGDGDGCQWEYSHPDENTEIRYCPNCDVTVTISSSAIEVIDECKTRGKTVYTFSKNGEDLLSFDHDRIWVHHDIYAELTLLEGAETCRDGFTKVERCMNCDYAFNCGEYYDNECWAELVERTVYSDERMCGDLMVSTYSCACGTQYRQETEWVDGECVYAGYSYDPETGTETGVCENCNVRYTIGVRHAMKEGHSCIQVETCDFSFTLGNSELFSFTRTTHNGFHSFYSEFEMNGDSCKDGYHAYTACRDCGHIWNNYYYENDDCENSFVLDSEVILDGKNICGKLVKETVGCACGKNVSSQIIGSYHTSNEYMGTDDEGWQIYECYACGLIERRKETYTYIQNSCEYKVYTQYEYWLNDEKIGETSTFRTSYDHQYTAEFKNFTGNCDDGYTVIQTCVLCGQISEWGASGCGSWATERTLIYLSETCGWTQVVHYNCPCGKVESKELNGCTWNHVGSDGEWDIYECSRCDLIRKTRSTTSSKVDSCEIVTLYEHVFEVNGEQVGAVTYEQVTDHNHANIVTTVNKYGDDCSDGYTVSGECFFCGETYTDETVYYGCQIFPTAIEVLCDEENACGNFYAVYLGCPCCERSEGALLLHSCNVTAVSSNEVDGVTTTVYLCEKCGMEVTEETSRSAVENSCEILITIDLTYRMNGEVVDTATAYAYDRTNHKYVYDLEAKGVDCSMGYTGTGTCYYCGDTRTVSGSGCATYLVNYQEVAAEGSCGTYILEITNCACGTHMNINEQDPCLETRETVHSEGSGDTMVEYYQCTECGMETRVNMRSGLLSERCFLGLHFDFEWIWDKEVISEYSYELAFAWDHKTVYTFEMRGESVFADGCDVFAHCQMCGVDMGHQGTIYSYDAHPVEFVEISDDVSICGGRFGYYLMAYPDGTPAAPQLTNTCSMTTSINEVTGATVQTCTSCGLVIEGSYTESWDRGTHDFYHTWDYTFRKNDQTIGTVNEKFHFVFHQDVFGFELLGEDCDDGYLIYATCAFCDIRMQIPGVGYGHEVVPVDIIDLATLGVCGDEAHYIQFSCPCKQYAGFDGIQQSCVLGEISEDIVQDGDTIIHTLSASCTNPGCASIMQTYQVTSVQPEGQCKTYMRKTYTFTLADGSEVSVYNNDVIVEHKGELVTTYELLDGVSCAGGVQETTICTSCNEVASSETYYECRTHQVEQIDMSELGATCGGYLAKSECACGTTTLYEVVNLNCNLEETAVDLFVDNAIEEGYYDTVSEQIYVSNTATVQSCAVEGCDYSVRIANYWTKEGCKLVNYEIAQYGYDAATGKCELELVSTLNKKEYHPNESLHTYRELMEYSNYCDQGAWLITVCTDCGQEISRSEYYGCETFPQEDPINLTEYGSLCGGYLVKMDCLCGQADPETIYSFQDLKCDLDKDEIAHFVEGTLDDEGRLYHGGHNWVDSESYLYTCAVNNPYVCGMKIRYSRCWLQEGCYAVEYEVWQLDYDSDTNTWAKEIREATGNTMIFHPYETTNIYNDTAEGYANGTGYECPLCGTYGSELNYWTKDEATGSEWNSGFERIYVSTLEADQCVRVRNYSELVQINNNVFDALYRYEISNNTGYDYWYQYEYEYDVTNGCYEKETYTNSDGQNDVNEYINEHRHGRAGYWTTDQEPTCAQFGHGHNDWYCNLCGQLAQVENRILDPNDHTWDWNTIKQIYECRICGLENGGNAGGSIDGSGSIVLEELTKELGNGTDYVVAYWNRGNINYSVYINVVMNDMEGDNERWLDINWGDENLDEYGSKAVRFNIAEAEAAAKAIMEEEGYTGDYAIRLTFAPTDVTGELDYSITFSSRVEPECNHLTVCAYENFTGNCDDGYSVIEYCALCGKIFNEFGTGGCNIRITEVTPVYYSETCGWTYIGYGSCPCGNYEDIFRDSCAYSNHMDNDGTYDIYSCETCGLTLKEQISLEYEEGSCTAIFHCEMLVEMNGETVATADEDIKFRQHVITCEFEDFTGNCDDGYTVKERCVLCGMNRTYEFGGCGCSRVDVTLLYQSETCGWAYGYHEKCPCGRYDDEYYYDGCNWQVHEYGDDGWEIQICSRCGTVRKVHGIETEWIDQCHYTSGCDYVFEQNGVEVGTARERYTNTVHLFTYEFEDFTGNCQDSFRVIQTCITCGQTESWYHSGCAHWTTEITPIHWSETCGWTYWYHSECPCGNREPYEDIVWSCSRSYMGTVDGWDTYYCSDCGLTKKLRRYTESIPDSCEIISGTETVFELNGEIIYSNKEESVSHNHYYYVTDVVRMGEDCSDGYTVSGECYFCSEPYYDETVYYGCQSFPVQIQLLCDEETICGKVSTVYMGCPCCGKITDVQDLNFCSVTHTYYTEGNTTTRVSTCSVCGLEATLVMTQSAAENSCEVLFIGDCTFRQNGEILTTDTIQFSVGNNHKYVYELTANGNSCDAGYTAVGTCYYCGDRRTETGSGCVSYLVNYQTVNQPGSCGANTDAIYNCACGRSISFGGNYSCNMEMIDGEYDEYGNGVEHYTCTECGMQTQVTGTVGLINDTCGMGVAVNITWIWENEVIANYDLEYAEYTDHKIVYTFNMLGDSLFADGCELYAHCDLCGLDLGYQGITYEYGRYPVDYVHIYDNRENAPICGNGRLGYYLTQAPNGDPQDPVLSTGCTGFIISTSDLPGYTIETCAQCGLEQEYISSMEWTGNECQFLIKLDSTLRMNGKELGRINEVFTAIAHAQKVSFTFLGEDCDDGYVVHSECTLCDISMEIPGTYYGHQVDQLAIYPLYILGVCPDANGNAYAIQYGCPCRQTAYFELFGGCTMGDLLTDELVQIDENTTMLTQSVQCQNPECATALHTVEIISTQAEGGCEVYTQITYTIKMKNGTEFSFQQKEVKTNHQGEQVVSYTLDEGATTCSGGAYEKTFCSACGNVINSRFYRGCETHLADIIDVSEFGSSCGGYVGKYECACGAIIAHEIMDTNCNLEYAECELFVTDAIAAGTYATANGNIEVINQASMVTCKNEGCNLTFRGENYWKIEDGKLVNYEIIQIGYDPTTGVYDLELISRFSETECLSSEPLLTSQALTDKSKGAII